MQEWVDTLRLKLREMKILSPKENLYSKLPEIRPPLLPTRDPTRDPLPATPPVPAAIVPGVIVNTTQTSRTTALPVATTASSTTMHVTSAYQSTESVTSNAEAIERSQHRRTTPPSRNTIENESDNNNDDSFVIETPASTTTASLSSTSNTLSQNLIKMLYPLPNFSHPINDLSILPNESGSGSDESFISDSQTVENVIEPNDDDNPDDSVHSLARTFAANVLFDANTSSSSKRSQNVACSSNAATQSSCVVVPNNRTNDDTISVDSSVYGIYPTPEPIVIPRPQTSRGSAAKSKKSEPVDTQTKDASGDAATTNITIIQVSSASVKEKLNVQNECAEKPETNYMNNVQIIPSNYSPAEQNAVITVQVTSDANTPSQLNEPVVSVPTSANKSAVLATIPSDSHDEVKSARQFGAVTNISIGEKQAFQQEQMHYEQVFITHTPSGASISTGNSEPSDILPKINRIKVDSALRSDDTDVRPSTSTSSTVTLSVAAAAASIADSSVSNSAAKSKETSKNRTVENNQENDALSARRPLLSRGVTEAVIMRPSRKDVNMLLNRITPQGNHVSVIIIFFLV